MEKAIEKRLNENMTIKQMGQELCSGVKYQNRKIIRIITDMKGSDYLIENAKTLDYKGTGKRAASRKKQVQKITLTLKESEMSELGELENKVTNICNVIDDLNRTEKILIRWHDLNYVDKMRKTRLYLKKAEEEIIKLKNEIGEDAKNMEEAQLTKVEEVEPVVEENPIQAEEAKVGDVKVEE